MPEKPEKAPPSDKPEKVQRRYFIELVNPDDVLILGVNDRWFRSFTSSSDRYPLKFQIPPDVMSDHWNYVTGVYTNVALTGKNDANVEYRVLLDDRELVHVIYKTEVQPQTFSVTFKDTFSPYYKPEKTAPPVAKGTDRFKDMMAWQKEGKGPPG